MGNSKKKGNVSASRLLGIIILFIVVLVVGAYAIHKNCKVTQQDFDESNVSIFGKINFWFKDKVFLCEKEYGLGFIGRTLSIVSNIFGFDANFYGFLGDLGAGALVGLWIYLVFILAALESTIVKFIPFQSSTIYIRRLEKSWLGFIGGSAWKIVPIAVVYAVMMQIPFLNRAIWIVSLGLLLNYKGIWGTIIQSFIIAFIVGFLPAAIEQYSRYRTRKIYYAAIEREKAIMAIERARIKK